MFKAIVFSTIVFFASICQAQYSYPDGTLVFSSKKGLIGRVAKRITGGDQYTHVGIIIDGYIYEQDFPKSKKTPLSYYRYKPRSTNDFYVPATPFSQDEVAKMKMYAESHLGQSYQLRNYFRPGSRKTSGNWCSPWTGKVLNSSGKFNISYSGYFEPQNLLNCVRKDYHLHRRLIN
jgi:hypothetical protein